jgi:hypothetical protein
MEFLLAAASQDYVDGVASTDGGGRGLSAGRVKRFSVLANGEGVGDLERLTKHLHVGQAFVALEDRDY